ncbi:hypothetical protein GPALN_007478 [Globodera pallida]|nr:hypothetical protein GPALN_007478 [Globodera pallida]
MSRPFGFRTVCSPFVFKLLSTRNLCHFCTIHQRRQPKVSLLLLDSAILNRPILFVGRASSSSFNAFFKRRWNPGKLSKLSSKEQRIDETCRWLGWITIMVGVTFASLPLYRMFCESTGLGGTTQVAKSLERIENMEKVTDRLLRVQFNADVPSSMQWKFKPVQNEIYVHPGDTALAFFTAENPTDKPIIGISTYNVTPFEAAYYFNKIQCFCFDEQILMPHEQVDLPVFFYIDPDFANDPALEYMDDLMLSYTFFESKSDLKLPSPFDPSNRPMMVNNDNNQQQQKSPQQQQQQLVSSA